jgi:hypothetical protein
MPVEEAPDDEDVRQSYNFAPGYHGIVYRADVPDYGAGARHHKHGDEEGRMQTKRKMYQRKQRLKSRR